MARRKDSPQKAAMREMMRDYLKNNDISIKDTGVGMSEEFIKHKLFVPFVQENLQVSFWLYFRQTATICFCYAISGWNGTQKQLQICPSKISMAPMPVDQGNTVLKTSPSPVDWINFNANFLFYSLNLVSICLRNAYLMHDKNQLHIR